VSYSIRYDLVDGMELKPQPEYETGRAALQRLVTAIQAYPWSALFGTDFLGVGVAAIRKDLPSALRFEFQGERPAALGVVSLIARIDQVVDDLRKTPS
jgi:hypothetical protein